MNNEIKEILDNLEDTGFMYKRISLEEIKKIVDYMTNLQQEYVDYEDKIDQLTNNWNELEKWCKNNLGYYGSDIGIIYKYVLDKMKEIKEKKK